MHVSHSRHFRAAIAAAALTTCVVGFVGPGVASADTTDTAAAGVVAAPVRFHEAGDLFKVLQFPTLPGADSGSADQAQPGAVETAPAPEAAPAPPPPPPPLAVTPDELARIVPGMPAEKIAAYVEPLNAAMTRGGIDNPVRQAAFIAQLAVESDSFRTFEEYASGRAYEGRADLGNTHAGDGERYKGRGAIQITGRHNYESVSAYTGVDFVAQPELLEAPENAFATAAWYWTSRNLNQVADTAGIVRVSELVNGGHHALDRRVRDFQRGLDVLLQP